MKRHLVQSVLLHAASLLVPSDQRREWLEEWRSELWYMRPEATLRASLGSFPDALWLRKSAEAPQKSMIYSARGCLAVLFAAGVAGLFAAKWLLVPLAARAGLWRLAPADLLPALVLMLLLSVTLISVASVSVPRAGLRSCLPKAGRARRGLFLAAKLIAVQPIMLCGLFVYIMTAATVPFTAFGVLAGWYLVLRWLLADQRNRCPQCLRLLDRPVSVGTPASTFLELHVTESACPRAHGLLHLPESGLSYPATGTWVSLDASWSSVFCTRARGRGK